MERTGSGLYDRPIWRDWLAYSTLLGLASGVHLTVSDYTQSGVLVLSGSDGFAFVIDLAFACGFQFVIFGLLPGDVRRRRRQHRATLQEPTRAAGLAKAASPRRVVIWVAIVTFGAFVLGVILAAIGLDPIRSMQKDEPAVKAEVSSPIDACEQFWSLVLRGLRERSPDPVMKPLFLGLSKGAYPHDVVIATHLEALGTAESAATSRDSTLMLMRRCMALGWTGPTEAELAELEGAVTRPAPGD